MAPKWTIRNVHERNLPDMSNMTPAQRAYVEKIFFDTTGYYTAERMLYEHYLSCPSLKDIPISAKEKGDAAYYASLAKQGFDPTKLSDDGRYYDGKPIGKVVI